MFTEVYKFCMVLVISVAIHKMTAVRHDRYETVELLHILDDKRDEMVWDEKSKIK